MNKKSKIGLLAIAVIAIVGVGVASAHGGFGKAVGEHCSDDITVGECRQILEAHREEQQAERYAKCVEEKGQEFCDEKVAEMEERRAAREAHREACQANPDSEGCEKRGGHRGRPDRL